MKEAIAELQDWRRDEETAKKAVDEYVRKQDANKLFDMRVQQSKAWIVVLKKVAEVLVIVTAIAAAYAASKGINL